MFPFQISLFLLHTFFLIIHYHYFFCVAVTLKKEKIWGNWNRLTLIFTPSWACISITFLLFPILAHPFLFLSLSLTAVIFFKKFDLIIFWPFSLCFCISLQWYHRQPSCRFFFPYFVLAFLIFFWTCLRLVGCFYFHSVSLVLLPYQLFCPLALNKRSCLNLPFLQKIILHLFHIQILVFLIQANQHHRLEVRN